MAKHKCDVSVATKAKLYNMLNEYAKRLELKADKHRAKGNTTAEFVADADSRQVRYLLKRVSDLKDCDGKDIFVSDWGY
jgi:hypothetical protein